MPRYAVIDVGTNSIKLHIAERHTHDAWSVLLDMSKISRLGDGMTRTGAIQPEAMTRNVDAITKMMKTIESYGVDDVVAVGTMCLRTASNSGEFVHRVQESCGVTLQILPGEEEARLSYLAVKSSIHKDFDNVLIFDTGGGSTECIFGKHSHIDRRISLNIGAVRYTEEILVSDPVTPEEVRAAFDSIEKDFAPLSIEEPVDALIGIGGGVTTICAVKHQLNVYTPERVEGTHLALAEIERQIALYSSKTLAERKQIVGLPPQRADVILAGVMIVNVMMRKAGVTSLTVSDRGLRHGLIIDRFYD